MFQLGDEKKSHRTSIQAICDEPGSTAAAQVRGSNWGKAPGEESELSGREGRCDTVIEGI